MDLKQELRVKILNKRRYFVQSQYHVRNKLIIDKLSIILDSFSSDWIIGGFIPLRGEPDITSLYTNRHIALPKIILNKMRFIPYRANDPLTKNSIGSQWPLDKVGIVPNIIIAPALAYDLKGYRLGFGKGNYDIYLEEYADFGKIIKIGVCFDKYLVRYLPRKSRDIKFDYIVTDKMILKL